MSITIKIIVFLLCAMFSCRSVENAENGENEDSPVKTKIGVKLLWSFLQPNKTRMFTLCDISLLYM